MPQRRSRPDLHLSLSLARRPYSVAISPLLTPITASSTDSARLEGPGPSPYDPRKSFELEFTIEECGGEFLFCMEGSSGSHDSPTLGRFTEKASRADSPDTNDSHTPDVLDTFPFTPATPPMTPPRSERRSSSHHLSPIPIVLDTIQEHSMEETRRRLSEQPVVRAGPTTLVRGRNASMPNLHPPAPQTGSKLSRLLGVAKNRIAILPFTSVETTTTKNRRTGRMYDMI